jgi:hypothetical protein
MTQVKTINKEGFYYTLSGDDLFRCCGEYQDRDYCISHDKFQGCAFCEGHLYYEPCSLGSTCESDAFDEMFAGTLDSLSKLTIIK